MIRDTAAEASLNRYFNAVSLNKIKDVKLRETETKLDDERRKVLTKFWKEKFDILDDLVQINVKTPAYLQSKFDGDVEKAENGRQMISLEKMSFDAKLLSGGPMTIKKKKFKQEGEIVKPVIDVVGTEAICYPNSDSKRGRHVKLAPRTTRTLEAAKAHEHTLETLSQQKYTRCSEKPTRLYTVRTSKTVNLRTSKTVNLNRRPFTAPRPRRRSPTRTVPRPRTVVGFHKE